MSAEINAPILNITVQPALRHRFRYLKEKVKGDFISGRNGKPYPSIHIENCEFPVTVQVTIMSNEDRPREHFMLLSNEDCQTKDSESSRFTIELEPKCMRYEFKKLKVTLLKQNEVPQSMFGNEDWKDTYKKMGSDSIRLRFSLFRRDSGDLLDDKISEPIYNKKVYPDLDILRLYASSGTVGKENLLLLGNPLPENSSDFKVMFQVGSEIFKTKISEVHKKHVVQFDVPRELKYQAKYALTLIHEKEKEFVSNTRDFTCTGVDFNPIEEDLDIIASKQARYDTEEFPLEQTANQPVPTTEEFLAMLHNWGEIPETGTQFYGQGPSCTIQTDRMRDPYDDNIVLPQSQLDYSDRLPYFPEDRGFHTLDPHPNFETRKPPLRQPFLNPKRRPVRGFGPLQPKPKKTPSIREMKANDMLRSVICSNRQVNLFKFFEDRLNCVDDNGDTFLHLAIISRNISIVRDILTLLDTKSNPDLFVIINKRNYLRQTALHLAVLTDMNKAIAPLLDLLANPGILDYRGRTALHLAVMKRNSQAVLLFLNSQSRLIDEVDYEGMTALHYAVKMNEYDICELLLKFDCNCLLKTRSEGNSALMLAIIYNQLEIARLLLEEEPRIGDVKNYSRCTPMDFALYLNNRDMVHLLEEFGCTSVCIASSSSEEEYFSDFSDQNEDCQSPIEEPFGEMRLE